MQIGTHPSTTSRTKFQQKRCKHAQAHTHTHIRVYRTTNTCTVEWKPCSWLNQQLIDKATHHVNNSNRSCDLTCLKSTKCSKKGAQRNKQSKVVIPNNRTVRPGKSLSSRKPRTEKSGVCVYLTWFSLSVVCVNSLSLSLGIVLRILTDLEDEVTEEVHVFSNDEVGLGLVGFDIGSDPM